MQASLSEQIRDVRKLITNAGPAVVTPPVNMDMNAEQRLAKVETAHQNILQMLDDLKRRVEQLEINKQTISGVRYMCLNIDRKKKISPPIFFLE